MLVRTGLLDVDKRLNALRVRRSGPALVETRAEFSYRAVSSSAQDFPRRELDLTSVAVAFSFFLYEKSALK